jgi:hypothetical protein
MQAGFKGCAELLWTTTAVLNMPGCCSRPDQPPSEAPCLSPPIPAVLCQPGPLLTPFPPSPSPRAPNTIADVVKFLRMLTFLPLEEVAAIEAAMQVGGRSWGQQQRELGLTQASSVRCGLLELHSSRPADSAALEPCEVEQGLAIGRGQLAWPAWHPAGQAKRPACHLTPTLNWPRQPPCAPSHGHPVSQPVCAPPPWQAPGYVANTAQRRLAEEVTRFVHGEQGLQQALKATAALAPGAGAFCHVMRCEAEPLRWPCRPGLSASCAVLLPQPPLHPIRLPSSLMQLFAVPSHLLRPPSPCTRPSQPPSWMPTPWKQSQATRRRRRCPESSWWARRWRT